MIKKTTKKTSLTKSAKLPRAATRFKPDPLTVVYLSLKSSGTSQLVALILNESFTGCAILVSSEERFKIDQKVFVKVGNLHAMAAQIIWSTQLDENIFKIGLKYLE